MVRRKNSLLITFLSLLIVAGSISYTGGQELSDALVSLSAGTGFVVHSDGYILTNEHVVRDASSISVFLNDAQVEYEGTVIVTDAANDLALIKIGCTRLPAVVLGDSDDVSLFDPIVSLGYPSSLALGTDLTTSTGQVTAVRTNMEGREGKETFQTDGAIYHGSSGGPLVNMSAEVIGVNYAGTEGAEFYFAIPIRDASQVFHSIPDFDLCQESSSTEALSAQDVVDRVRPCIAYIRVEIERPLTDLLPEEALGSALESWSTDFSPPSFLPSIDANFNLVEPVICTPDPRYGARHYSTSRVHDILADEGLDVGFAAGRENRALLGSIGRDISVAVFDLETEAAAEAGRRALQESVAELPNLLLSDSRLLDCGPLSFAVWWDFWGDDSFHIQVGRGHATYRTDRVQQIASEIEGTGVYAIGKLLFVVSLCDHDLDEVEIEGGWSFHLASDDADLLGDRVVASTTIYTGILVGDPQYKYEYRSAWSVDEFVDDFIELLNTSIAALSE